MPDLDLSAGMISRMRGRLPEPLQRVLGSTGLNLEGGAPLKGGNGYPAIASVAPGSVNTITVEDPHKFTQDPSILAHEGTHLWQANLPPTIRAKVPDDDPNNYYDFGGTKGLTALRAKGKTLSTVPDELGASIVGSYTKQGGKLAPNDVQQAYAPWLQDMRNTPLSTIIPTQPGQVSKFMNTTPRPPLPQF